MSRIRLGEYVEDVFAHWLFASIQLNPNYVCLLTIGEATYQIVEDQLYFVTDNGLKVLEPDDYDILMKALEIDAIDIFLEPVRGKEQLPYRDGDEVPEVYERKYLHKGEKNNYGEKEPRDLSLLNAKLAIAFIEKDIHEKFNKTR